MSYVCKNGPMVKRLRHRPFTAVTRVQIPLGSKGTLRVPLRFAEQNVENAEAFFWPGGSVG